MTIYFAQIRRFDDDLVLTSTIDDELSISSLKNEAEKHIKRNKVHSQFCSFPCERGSLHIASRKPIYSLCYASADVEPKAISEFLQRVNNLFLEEHEEFVPSAESTYAFSDFSLMFNTMRETTQKHYDANSLSDLNRDLSQVEQSMNRNIDRAIIRDSKLKDVSNMSDQMSRNSSMFADRSRKLNQLHLWRTYGRPSVIVGIISSVYLFVKFLL